MKYCSTCETNKSLSTFSKRKASKDGYAHRCRVCQKVYDKARSKDPHREEARRVYAQTDEGRISGNKAKAEYRKRNPGKAKAHAIVNRAIRAGNLFKKPCAKCGSTACLHAHHDDYLEPLNVRWLCPGCHSQWHRDNGPGLNGD